MTLPFSPQKTTLSALTEKQAFSLDLKIKHSLSRISEFYAHVDGKVYISFSGGVDSVVLLHLVRSIYPEAVAVFSDTTNEFPEILSFVKTVDNVIWVKPKITFLDVIKKYGFPLVSKKVSRSISDLRNPTDNNYNIRHLYLTGFNREGTYCPSYKLAKKWLPLISAPFDITSKCCDILKKEPLQKFERKYKLFPYVGTMADDSNLRLRNYLQHGCNVYSDHRLVSRPLSIWSKQDIWDYIRLHNLSYSSIYDSKTLHDGTVVDGEHNTGCQYCAFGAHLEKDRFVRLSLRRPKQFKAMMAKENNGVSFFDALKFVGAV